MEEENEKKWNREKLLDQDLASCCFQQDVPSESEMCGDFRM